MDPNPYNPSRARLEAWWNQPERYAQATRALQRLAQAIVGDASTAEDIVQGAWVESLQAQHRNKGMGWLRRLVRSRSIDSYRQRARAPQSLDALPEAAGAAGREAWSERLAGQRELIEALEALREPYGSTLYLRFVEGLGPQAIAAQQAIPVSTVKTRLQRGLDQLREQLRHSGGDGRWSGSPALLAFARSEPSGASSSLVSPALHGPLLFLTMKQLWIPAVTMMALLAGWWALGGEEPTSSAGVGRVENAGDLPTPDADQSNGLAEPGVTPNQREVLPATDPGAPTTEVVSDLGSLRVHVLRADGSPARHVHVIASSRHAQPQLQVLHRRSTDDGGWAEFESLASGVYSLRTDRQRSKRPIQVEILVGQSVSAQLPLPAGVHVTGTVVDGAGSPVPGAAVWLTSDSPGWTGGAVVAHADGLGRFEVLDVPAGQSLGAFAPGFQRSDLQDLDLLETDSGTVEITLALERGGAELVGIVRNPEGQPVVGALVAVGDTRQSSRVREDNSFAEVWSPNSVRTDERGAYELVGLVLGQHALQVRAHGLATWSGTFDAVEGQRTVRDVRMETGQPLFGVVTDQQGQGVAGARVFVLREPLEESYLQGGQVDFYGAFEAVGALTDANGAYSIPAVASGQAYLYVIEPKPPGFTLFEDVAFVREVRALSASEPTEWSPVLTDGAVIEGRARYSDGEPIDGVFLVLKGKEGDGHRVVRCAEGRFRFKSLGHGPYSIRAQMWDVPLGKAEPFIEGVSPGGPPVEIVADFPSPKAMQPAQVSVRFLDVAGRCQEPSNAHIVLVGDGHYQRIHGHAHEQGWSFKVEIPGAYRPVAFLENRVLASGPRFSVQGGERIRLPDLVSQPGGTLVLEFQKEHDFRLGPLWTGVTAEGAATGESFSIEGRPSLRLENLTAGPTSVLVRGDNVVEFTMPVHVMAGQTTTLVLPLQQAVPVTYTIPLSEAERKGSLRVQVLNRSTGQVFDDFERADLARYGEVFRWRVFLPIGQYALVATKSGQPSRSLPFQVDSFDPMKAPKLTMER